ncbi:MAG: LysR family transcriptional regulator [Gammaproteobacteria bacterium]|nr:LysR family transcriptional regulator [Gammaproteobacteria bacterium]
MKNLNFRHLLYFRQVAKLGHLTRAAAQLRVSQSALSAQIRALEHYLGRPLFDRQGRSLVLTEFGATVLDYADGIFGLGHELLATVRADQAQRVQRLRVGAVATLSRNFLENLLRPTFARPEVRLSLESGSLEELLGRLQVHNLDLVFSNRPVVAEAGKAWRCVRIDRQSVCLVGPPRPRGRPFKVPDHVAGARFVLPGPSSDIRSQFDLWCERHRLSIEVVAEVDDMAMLRLLARDSGAITVLPEVVVQDELREARLQSYGAVPGVFENFYAITAFRRRPSPLVQNLLTRARVSGTHPPAPAVDAPRSPQARS